MPIHTLSFPLWLALAPVASPVAVATIEAAATTAPKPPTTDGLPADARLDPSRAAIEQQVARARALGLPTDVVVAKVREGLAKNVPSDLIAAAVVRLVSGLETARNFAAEQTRRPPSAVLVAALARAQLAGVELPPAAGLLRASKDDASAARSVSVLTDLASRGYPVARASGLVADVASQEPDALGRVAFALDSLRQQQSLTPLQAVDSLSRSLEASVPLDVAIDRSSFEAERAGNGRGRTKADDGDAKPGRGLGLGLGRDKPGKGPKQ